MKNLFNYFGVRLTVFSISLVCIVQNAYGETKSSHLHNNALYKSLVIVNDQEVDKILNQSNMKNSTQYNRTRYDVNSFAVLSASYCTSDSKYYQSEIVLDVLNTTIDKLLNMQGQDGLFNSGGNIASPPDMAFLLESLGPAAKILFENEVNLNKGLNDKLRKFLLKTGEALIIGGIHTPNHRWVVAAALARLYDLFGDERYVKRIDQWLAENIYIDADGQYPERSRNYAVVVDRSLITIADILKRPQYLAKVTKNLESTYYFMEENGELITTDSRRQDQNFLLPVYGFYLEYRYIANQTQNEFMAAVARKIENLENFNYKIFNKSLIYFLERPILFENLPGEYILPSDYNQLFSFNNTVRLKRGNTTATLFAGNDRPIIVASGRSTNPTFFTFRKGDAILDYVRLSTSFFRTGYFRSEGLEKSGDKYILKEKKEGYYFQPLSADKINPDGEYEFSQSTDKRFWSKMDFNSREISNIQTLNTYIEVYENNGDFNFDIRVDGAEQVEIVLELCFRKGGELINVQQIENSEDYMFNSEIASYKFGKDTIHIGPGKIEHNHIQSLDGEMYSTHFGSIKGEGMHLYLTGTTPFKHILTIK